MTTLLAEPTTPTLACHFDTAVPGPGAAPAGTAVLGRTAYVRRAPGTSLHDGAPLLGTCLAAPGLPEFTEVWTTLREVRPGREGALVYAEDGEYLFCATRVEEQGTYRDAVHATYDAALGLAHRLGYGELVRMWNFVGAVTGHNAEGTENYRDFCEGRARAFESWGDRIAGMPAATAVGALRPGIDISFLACRPGRTTHLENPRQIPAYRYAERYGPKPPSFARATHLAEPGGGRGTVFVSGTASIIGEDTVHPGDAGRQCEVTFANIEALVSRENLARHGIDSGFGLRDLGSVKVYVRDAADLPVVRSKCQEAFGDRADIAYVRTDICRPELLVEIEGVCR
ncbi:FkbO/Hyg5 family chorismatase [Streptomyces sp. NPDC002104]